MAKQSKLEVILRFIEDKTGITRAKAEVGFLIDRIKSLKDAGSAAFSALKSGASTFFLPLKTLAVPAIGAVTAALGMAGKALKEFAGQELGEQDVTSALVAMGQYTDDYKQKLIDLASTYQTTTGISDDFWLKSLGQLTRFGMNSENVNKVATALKNLTGLMDGNIDTATDAIAKALQGQFDTFSRFGIVVKTSGDDLKDFDKLVEDLNKKGAGLLEARANTLSGKWDALKTQANEVFEAIGQKIAGSMNVGGAIDTIKSKLATVTAAVQSGGLGDILEKAGEALRKKIEDAYNWAAQIATAIKESGKPIDQVFSEAMTGAAEAFMTALKALIEASMAIWKAVGIAIFNAFKEEALKLPGAGPIRDIAAGRAFDKMSPADRSKFASENGLLLEGSGGKVRNLVSAGPVSDDRRAEISAKLASYDAEAKIKAAIDEGATKLKEVGTQLKADLKAIGYEVAGISPGGLKSTGQSAAPRMADPVQYQQEYAQKMIDAGNRKPSGDAAPEKSMITIQGSDGEKITMALEEYIKQLSAQNDKQAEAANAGNDALEASTETIEAIKTTSEAVKKSAEEAKNATDANTEAHTNVKTALETVKTVSQQTALVAKQTQEELNALVGLVAQIAANQTKTVLRLGDVEGQIKNMRA